MAKKAQVKSPQQRGAETRARNKALAAQAPTVISPPEEDELAPFEIPESDPSMDQWIGYHQEVSHTPAPTAPTAPAAPQDPMLAMLSQMSQTLGMLAQQQQQVNQRLDMLEQGHPVPTQASNGTPIFYEPIPAQQRTRMGPPQHMENPNMQPQGVHPTNRPRGKGGQYLPIDAPGDPPPTPEQMAAIRAEADQFLIGQQVVKRVKSKKTGQVEIKPLIRGGDTQSNTHVQQKVLVQCSVCGGQEQIYPSEFNRFMMSEDSDGNAFAYIHPQCIGMPPRIQQR